MTRAPWPCRRGRYRFSIAWSRLFPTGEEARPNAAGVAYYGRLIDTLLAAGLTPLATLYHWDLPQALDAKYGGWLSPKMPGLFAKFAEACFAAFGDRVRSWITFNEPLTFVQLGYSKGSHAPGRCSDRSRCPAGNSSTEPYIAAHNVILAHGQAVRAYRQRYASAQRGQIGITLNSVWAEPYDSASAADRAAAERSLVFQIGWWGDPVFLGDYPATMKAIVGARLPRFSSSDKAMLKGSSDFYGLNHYTSKYVKARLSTNGPHTSASDQQGQGFSKAMNGSVIGVSAASKWLRVVPWGMRKNLQWVHARYSQPKIYITENGCDVPGEQQVPLHATHAPGGGDAQPAIRKDGPLNDQFRIYYYATYLRSMLQARDLDKINIMGPVPPLDDSSTLRTLAS